MRMTSNPKISSNTSRFPLSLSPPYSLHPRHLRPESPHLNPNRLPAPIRLNPHLIYSKRTIRSRVHQLPAHTVQRLGQTARILGLRTVDHSVVLPRLRAVGVLAHELSGVQVHVWVRGLTQAGEEGMCDVGGVGDERGEFEAWARRFGFEGQSGVGFRVGGGVGAGEIGFSLGAGGGVEARDEVGEDRFEEGGLRGSVAGAGCEDEYADVVVGDDGEAGVVKSWKEGLFNRT